VTNQLSVNFKITKPEERLNVSILKRNETKTLASAGLTVEHDGRVDDFAELREKFAHGLRCDAGCQTSNEQFCGTLMFLTRNSPFGIDLKKDLRSETKNVLEKYRADEQFYRPERVLVP
jgi:hypothetical protein